MATAALSTLRSTRPIWRVALNAPVALAAQVIREAHPASHERSERKSAAPYTKRDRGNTARHNTP